MHHNMHPLVLDQQLLEDTIASVLPIKDSLEAVLPTVNGNFSMYNINGSLAAFDSKTHYVYVWGITIHTFYLLDEEILNVAGSLKNVLSILHPNNATLESQHQKFQHAVEIISFKLSNNIMY